MANGGICVEFVHFHLHDECFHWLFQECYDESEWFEVIITTNHWTIAFCSQLHVRISYKSGIEIFILMQTYDLWFQFINHARSHGWLQSILNWITLNKYTIENIYFIEILMVKHIPLYCFKLASSFNLIFIHVECWAMVHGCCTFWCTSVKQNCI